MKAEFQLFNTAGEMEVGVQSLSKSRSPCQHSRFSFETSESLHHGSQNKLENASFNNV